MATCRDFAEQLVRIHEDGLISLVCHTPDSLDLDVARAMPLGLLIYEVLLNGANTRGQATSGALSSSRSPTRVTLRQSLSLMTASVMQRVPFAPGLGHKLVAALAQEAGAKLTSRTAPGEGTEVTLSIRL